MKRLSLLLALSLIGQSVLGLTLPEWQKEMVLFNAKFASIQAEFKTKPVQENLEAFLKQVSKLEKELKEVNCTITLASIYNTLMPVLKGGEVATFKTLDAAGKAAAKKEMLSKLAELKSVVKTQINKFSKFGRAKNAAYNAANSAVNSAASAGSVVLEGVKHPIATVKAAGNGIVSGTKAGASYAYNLDRSKKAATVATVAALVAAYRNKQAIKNALTVENAKSALSSVGSGIASGWNTSVSALGSVYDWAYDTRPVIASRVAMYAGLEKASDFAAAHPTAMYRTKVAAVGTGSTVVSAIAAVKAYKKYQAYKAAKLAAAQPTPVQV